MNEALLIQTRGIRPGAVTVDEDMLQEDTDLLQRWELGSCWPGLTRSGRDTVKDAVAATKEMRGNLISLQMLGAWRCGGDTVSEMESTKDGAPLLKLALLASALGAAS